MRSEKAKTAALFQLFTQQSVQSRIRGKQRDRAQLVPCSAANPQTARLPRGLPSGLNGILFSRLLFFWFSCSCVFSAASSCIRSCFSGYSTSTITAVADQAQQLLHYCQGLIFHLAEHILPSGATVSLCTLQYKHLRPAITWRLKRSEMVRFSSDRLATTFCCSCSPRISSNFSRVRSSMC